MTFSSPNADFLIASKDIINFSRRHIIGLGIIYAVLHPRYAFAQNSDYARISHLFSKSLGVRDFAIGVSLEAIQTGNGLIDYVEQDFFLRRITADESVASNIFNNAESSTLYLKNVQAVIPSDFPYDAYENKSQQIVIDMLNLQSLPIVPDPDYIFPIGVPSLPPTDKDATSDLLIVGDIILETLGISIGDKDLIVYFIESDEQIKEKCESLVNLISTQKWEDVFSLVKSVFNLFIGSKIWVELSKITLKKLTFRLALRCVPVVGWVYTAAAFLVAVKANYHRFSFA